MRQVARLILMEFLGIHEETIMSSETKALPQPWCLISVNGSPDVWGTRK